MAPLGLTSQASRRDGSLLVCKDLDVSSLVFPEAVGLSITSVVTGFCTVLICSGLEVDWRLLVDCGTVGTRREPGSSPKVVSPWDCFLWVV